MHKNIYLNIGLNNLQNEDIKLSEIMDSLAYSFDVKPFSWCHTWSTYEGEIEPTLVVAFNSDPIPDSTIIRKLEAMCTEYNQDSIAYKISQGNITYLEGLAWHPRVRENKYRFNPDYFKNLYEGTEGPQLYISENVPMGSKYNVDEIIRRQLVDSKAG